jgi:hypothetical protein
VILGDVTGAAGDRIVADAIRFYRPTGIAEELEPCGSELLLESPNPGRLFEMVLPGTSSDGQLGIYDLTGRMVHAMRVEASDGATRIVWPCGGNFPSGVYTAVFSAGGQVWDIRLVLLGEGVSR